MAAFYLRSRKRAKTDKLSIPATLAAASGSMSKAQRHEGQIPAVIYGADEEPQSIHVEEKILNKLLGTGHFFNSVVLVEIAGKKIRTLPKDVAFHPVTDRPLSADFLRISAHARVHVNVPLSFINENKAPGINRGGILNILARDIELICDASEIPDKIEIDLSGHQVGDVIRVGSLGLPAGSQAIEGSEQHAIATIVRQTTRRESIDSSLLNTDDLPEEIVTLITDVHIPLGERARKLGIEPGIVVDSTRVVEKIINLIAVSATDLFSDVQDALVYINEMRFEYFSAAEIIGMGRVTSVLARMDELRYGSQG